MRHRLPGRHGGGYPRQRRFLSSEVEVDGVGSRRVFPDLQEDGRSMMYRDSTGPPGQMPRTALIEASCYNRVRLALRLHGPELNLRLPGGRGFRMRLAGQEWHCLDERLGGAILLVWRGFRRTGGLDRPVHCLLHRCHSYARVIEYTVLADLERALTAMLPVPTAIPARVLPHPALTR